MHRAPAFGSLLALGALVALAAPPPAASQNANVPDAAIGTWVLQNAGRATRRRDAGIEHCVEEVFALGRNIARRRLRSGMPAHARLVVERRGTRELRLEMSDAYRVVQPVNGTPKRITDKWGSPIDSRLRVRGGALVQTLRTTDGESLITHRLEPRDDGTLVLSVRLANDQLDRDVTFRLVYRRAG
ncbi:MAG: hypothetical protein AAGH15_12735 [Myxococcota bacterium]